jgi:hypothetical protein
VPTLVPHPPTLSLLNPFINLTAVFATTLSAPEPSQMFPNALQELHLTAGTMGQVWTHTSRVQTCGWPSESAFVAAVLDVCIRSRHQCESC